jgi:hypothetical protein
MGYAGETYIFSILPLRSEKNYRRGPSSVCPESNRSTSLVD